MLGKAQRMEQEWAKERVTVGCHQGLAPRDPDKEVRNEGGLGLQVKDSIFYIKKSQKSTLSKLKHGCDRIVFLSLFV